MLTLIALPLLFEIFYNVKRIKFFPLRFIRSKSCIILLLFLFVPAFSAVGQQQELNLEQLTQMALKNNSRMKAYSYKTEQAKALTKTAFAIPKTYISYGTDQNNIAENGYPLKVWSIEQDLAFPSLYVAEKKVKNIEYDIAKTEFQLEKNHLLKEVSVSYFECATLGEKIAVYQNLDSIYTILLTQYEKKLELKDANKLEYLNIKSKRNQIALSLSKLETLLDISYEKLKVLVNSPEDFIPPKECDVISKAMINMDSLSVFSYMHLKTEHASSQIKVKKRTSLPDLKFNYFRGSNIYANSQNYNGFEVGLSVPLFFFSSKNTIKSAKLGLEVQKQLVENETAKIKGRIDELNAILFQNSNLIKQYKETEILLANEIKRTAIKSYNLGEIDFFHLTNSLETALMIESEYFDVVLNYNKIYLELLYFTN
jgi:cobalt-zinc-cadmium resistance protein CzcA